MSGTAEASDDGAVLVCAVGNAGARVKNLGSVTVFLGGPGVGADGYPLEAGHSEQFYGGSAKEAPVVPSPPADLAAAGLYARTAAGTGTCKVAWLGTGG